MRVGDAKPWIPKADSRAAASFGVENIKGKDVPYAEFTLTDGQLGDDTWVDGVILDIGAPGRAVVRRPVPAMSTEKPLDALWAIKAASLALFSTVASVVMMT